MDILLTCPECEYRKKGSSEKELANKITIWNNVKAAHPRTAERVIKVPRGKPREMEGASYARAMARHAARYRTYIVVTRSEKKASFLFSRFARQ